MATKNLYPLKSRFKRAMAAGLLSCASFGAFAQSYDWVIPPATRIKFTGTAPGVASSMGSSLPCFNPQAPQVISTASATNPAFAFVPNCGSYNLSGTNVSAKGYRNVFPVTGLCKRFYAVEWNLEHYPTPSHLMLRKLDVSNPAAIVQTDSVELFSAISSDDYSNTVAVGPMKSNGSRVVYFYEPNTNVLKSFTVSSGGTIGPVNDVCSVSISSTTYDRLNKMEISPSGRFILFSDNLGRVWCIDLWSPTFTTTDLTVSFPAGREIHGYEYVPTAGISDRVYISWHSGSSAGNVSYVPLIGPTTPINIFSTVALPPTTSQLSWGFTDIERGRDGQLYLANNPTAPAETSMSPGPIYVLNIDSNTLLPLKIGGTTQVYCRTYTHLGSRGYKIQEQIDGETFSAYDLSPAYNLNGVTQSAPPAIPQVALCDNAALRLLFSTGAYMTTGGVTLQKGNVSGSTFTPVGIPMSTIGNPLGAPTTSGNVNIDSMFNLGAYSGGIQLTVSFTNACTTINITQTFNIVRAGLVINFKLTGPYGCPDQNRVTNIASLASSVHPQPWPTTVYCENGWLGASSVGIKDPASTTTGAITVLGYYLKVEQVTSTGTPIGAPIIDTPISSLTNQHFNAISGGWFFTNYPSIKNSAYFKATLGANTTPCGSVERIAYFRIIDGGSAPYSFYKQALNGEADGDALQVFPNPASGKVQLNWQAGSQAGTDARIRLNDVLGKTVLQQSLPQQQGSNESSIDISQLAPGVYYYQMETGGTIHNGKITRQ